MRIITVIAAHVGFDILPLLKHVDTSHDGIIVMHNDDIEKLKASLLLKAFGDIEPIHYIKSLEIPMITQCDLPLEPRRIKIKPKSVKFKNKCYDGRKSIASYRRKKCIGPRHHR